jgi:hypothetical protein
VNLYKVILLPSDSPRNSILLGVYSAESNEDAIDTAVEEAKRRVLPYGNVVAVNLGQERRSVKEKKVAKKDIVHRNPYPNEHSARIAEPSNYKRFRRSNNKFGKGISAIWGITSDNYAELQSIRFDVNEFTENKAKLWLKRRGYESSVIKFEPARLKNNPATFLQMWNDIAANSKAELISIIRVLKREGVPNNSIINHMEDAGIQQSFAKWIMKSFVWR